MTDRQRLLSVVSRFGESQILVVGDLMLDRYIWGKVSRISPEAPVPVVQVTRESAHLGGAANVVANIRSLGGRAFPVGMIGTGRAGDEILHLLKEGGVCTDGVLRSPDFVSIQKTRIIAQKQQVVRVDWEEVRDLTRPDRRRFLQHVTTLLPQAALVVVSDYGKGLINRGLLQRLVRAEPRPLICVDPKDRNFGNYRDVDVITPNQGEAERMSGVHIEDQPSLMAAARAIFKRVGCRKLLITRGESGMALFESADAFIEISTQAREVFDVSGAGDTVIATYALSLASGASHFEAAALANLCAGIVVGKLGTASATVDELKGAIANWVP